jgi:hypothetical protein
LDDSNTDRVIPAEIEDVASSVDILSLCVSGTWLMVLLLSREVFDSFMVVVGTVPVVIFPIVKNTTVASRDEFLCDLRSMNNEL